MLWNGNTKAVRIVWGLLFQVPPPPPCFCFPCNVRKTAADSDLSTPEKVIAVVIDFTSPSSCRLSPQRHRQGACHILGTGAALQRERQLRPLQDHSGDVQLWQQGHLLLRPCRGALAVPSTEARAGQAAAAYLRDSIPNEQRSAAEVRPVPDHGAPHGGSAHGPETGG